MGQWLLSRWGRWEASRSSVYQTQLLEKCQPPAMELVKFSMKIRWAADDTGWIR